MFIENENTFQASLRNPINLVLGAGFSVLAEDKNGRKLPAGKELANELRANFSLEHLTNLDLPRLCTVIASAHEDELKAYLTDRFTVVRFDARYSCLEEQLNISAIFTTNIDNLLHKIFENSVAYYVNDLDLSGPVFGRRRALDLVMLHGSVVKPDKPFRFGATDVASSFSTDPDRWLYLQTRLKQHPTIFWGSSLGDAPLLEALIPLTSRIGSSADAWVVVHPGDNQDAIDYYHALNLQVIIADTSELLNFIQSTVPVKSTTENIRTRLQIENVFPSAVVPVSGGSLNRSILEFFRGFAPMWCDVYSGQLCRTSHFDKIRNSVNSGKHTIITGIPGSGKTTLLMQVAGHFAYAGHKLIFSELGKSEAEFVARRLDGENALILVDNFTNDVDAFSF